MNRTARAGARARSLRRKFERIYSCTNSLASCETRCASTPGCVGIAFATDPAKKFRNSCVVYSDAAGKRVGGVTAEEGGKAYTCYGLRRDSCEGQAEIARKRVHL